MTKASLVSKQVIQREVWPRLWDWSPRPGLYSVVTRQTLPHKPLLSNSLADIWPSGGLAARNTRLMSGWYFVCLLPWTNLLHRYLSIVSSVPTQCPHMIGCAGLCSRFLKSYSSAYELWLPQRRLVAVTSSKVSHLWQFGIAGGRRNSGLPNFHFHCVKSLLGLSKCWTRFRGKTNTFRF